MTIGITGLPGMPSKLSNIQPLTGAFVSNLILISYRIFVITHIVYYDNIKLSVSPGKKL